MSDNVANQLSLAEVTDWIAELGDGEKIAIPTAALREMIAKLERVVELTTDEPQSLARSVHTTLRAAGHD